MKPTDGAFRWLEQHALIRYDVVGNKHRVKWLSFVEVDADGCWIWTGHTSTLGYPWMSIGRGYAAFSCLLKLWMPEQYGEMRLGRRYRVCRKQLCVRPACASRFHSGPDPRERGDWAQIRLDLESGMSVYAISDKYGVSRSTVNEKVRRSGWRVPYRTAVKESRYLRYRVDYGEVRVLWETGLSYRELAEKFEYDVASMGNLCRRFKNGFLGPAIDPAPDRRSREIRKARRRRLQPQSLPDSSKFAYPPGIPTLSVDHVRSANNPVFTITSGFRGSDPQNP